MNESVCVLVFLVFVLMDLIDLVMDFPVLI